MADQNDLLKEAIAGTENEIFSEAVGADLPSTEGGPGDRSAEEMGDGLEGQHEGADDETETVVEAKDSEDGEAKDGDEAADGEAEGEDKNRNPDGTFKAKKEGDAAEDAAVVADQGGDKSKARVPVGELMTERKARQAADTENARLTKLLADQETSIAAVNRRLDAMLQQPPPKQKTAEEEAEAPDDVTLMFENPKGFIANLKADLNKDFTTRFVNADLARTHAAEGEKFEKAYTALTAQDKNDPAARASVQKIMSSDTPGLDLMKWYNKQEAARVVGDDPAAFQAKIEAETRAKLAKDPEFRKQLLAELQAEANGTGGSGAPRTVARMPKSLNGAAGGQSNGVGRAAPGDSSDRGVFESAFAPQS